MKPERLDKILAAQGGWSRKDVKALVSRGAVAVNGQTALRPEQKVDPERDQVTVEGRAVTLRRHIYLLLNKPAGVVSATRDPRERTVVDLVPEPLRRRGIFPAGRLDKDTTGMMILTDDGDFAHRILSPRNHVPKTYLARLDRPVTAEMETAFAAGIPLKDGDCLPARLERGEEDLARVTICEGMYHQIKRMFGVCGARVVALQRISMGGLELDGSLAEGECRELRKEELARIRG